MTESGNCVGGIELVSIDAVTYEDDDGRIRRRYWDGDDLVDEVIPR